MKIAIVGVPTFQMQISREMVDALLLFSQHHYDGRCRDVGREGGFLYGWHNMMDVHPRIEVRASWRDADLTLKLCESPASRETPEMIAMVTDYVMSLRHAMNVASDTHWEIKVSSR